MKSKLKTVVQFVAKKYARLELRLRRRAPFILFNMLFVTFLLYSMRSLAPPIGAIFSLIGSLLFWFDLMILFYINKHWRPVMPRPMIHPEMLELPSWMPPHAAIAIAKTINTGKAHFARGSPDEGNLRVLTFEEAALEDHPYIDPVKFMGDMAEEYLAAYITKDSTKRCIRNCLRGGATMENIGEIDEILIVYMRQLDEGDAAVETRKLLCLISEVLKDRLSPTTEPDEGT